MKWLLIVTKIVIWLLNKYEIEVIIEFSDQLSQIIGI